MSLGFHSSFCKALYLQHFHNFNKVFHTPANEAPAAFSAFSGQHNIRQPFFYAQSYKFTQRLCSSASASASSSGVFRLRKGSLSAAGT